LKLEKDGIKMIQKLNQMEQTILLKIARQAIETAVQKQPLPELDLEGLPTALFDPGASFVTLTMEGRLRGCIGTLDPYQPLARDVQEHAVAAALHDYRFTAVKPAELPLMKIEVSVLTGRVQLSYHKPQELVAKLRPHTHGVILQDGSKKATFLPQVWEQLPDAEDFLSHLCVKMGAPGDIWRHKPLDIFVYQVQEFQE
jgi:AmmeMemoRadiSam system protein A